MIVQPYDYLLIAWFILASLSTLYVAVDQFRNNLHLVCPLRSGPSVWLMA